MSSQVIQRDRHAELMTAIAITGASLEKFALEVRGLQKTEIGEVQEPFGKGQKGSSAMPHKRNPVGCEQITGLARLLRANAHAALENIALWHERDISHSSVERVILPDSFIALDHMLRRFTRIVKGLVVSADRMRQNLELSRGVVFSGTVLLELAQRGISREQAYEWVQRNALRSYDEKKDFKQLLLADRGVMAVVDRKTIDDAFDLKVQLKNVDKIFDRVFKECRSELECRDACACIRDVEAVGVRPAGQDHCRRAAFARLRGRRGRAAGQIFRARARRRVERHRALDGVGSRRQVAGESCHRELSD